MFTKRPNFLNSTPTSTESMLQLLSAPSIRFWQQTAVCPVSLWTWVIELHPLNWARAQGVCSISYKVTVKQLEERARVRVCARARVYVCVRVFVCARARACVCVCVCVWNFAANLVNILQRHFNCLTKHMGRTVWAEHSAMSGLSILKRAECWLVKIPGLNDLQHQQMMTMSKEFMLWFV